MGVFDNLKDAAESLEVKATSLVDDHGDQIGDGLDKAGEFVDDKTGSKYGDKIDEGVGAAKGQLDNLDGQNDDIADAQA
jgi:hypothetical protein